MDSRDLLRVRTLLGWSTPSPKLAHAPDDEREVTEDELEALRAARPDARPLVPGATITAAIARRAHDEE